jgi:hypothetical protein
VRILYLMDNDDAYCKVPTRMMFSFTPKTAPALLEIIEHGGILELIAQVLLDTSFVDRISKSPNMMTLRSLINQNA